jgi:hypothetical protein
MEFLTCLSSHQSELIALVVYIVASELIEFYLGRSTTVKSKSKIDLALGIIRAIIRRLLHAKTVRH